MPPKTQFMREICLPEGYSEKLQCSAVQFNFQKFFLHILQKVHGLQSDSGSHLQLLQLRDSDLLNMSAAKRGPNVC